MIIFRNQYWDDVDARLREINEAGQMGIPAFDARNPAVKMYICGTHIAADWSITVNLGHKPNDITDYWIPERDVIIPSRIEITHHNNDA